MYKRTGPVNKETQDDLRAAAILPVFALKKNFEFGWKPPVQILDINAVSVGTTLQPAGLEASKAVISVNYSRTRSIRAGRTTPARKNISLHGEVLCGRRQSLRSSKFGDFQTGAQPTGAGQQETPHSLPNQRNVVLS